jgi:hypothetical protein
MTNNTNQKSILHLRMFRLLCVFVLSVCLSAVINPALAQVPTKTIYFLAGPKDHVGAEGTGRHETRRDLLVLQHCIDSISNVKGVKIITKFLYQRDALNIEDLKGADAIIVECSSVTSTQTRTHPLLPPMPPGAKTYDKATLAYLNQIDSLQAAGMGIMIIHWGVGTEGNQPATEHYMRWFGETSMPNYTQNPLGFWKVTPIKASEKHPILRGVGPWAYKDEIFSRLIVNPNDPYRTDLLMGESPQTNQSEYGSPKGAISPRGIASAYEKGKQRGVLWGGMDYHSALLNENYLRFVLNEIVWTAGIEVPKGGVKTAAKQLQLSPVRTDSFDKLKPADFVLK